MTSINLTARLGVNASLLRDRITTLGEQISTGRKGNTYSTIGTDAPKAMDLRAEIGRRDIYETTIDQTLGKIRVSQDVLDRIGAVAQKFLANSAKLLGASRSEEIQVQAGQAEAAMIEVASLLNEQFSGEYLFGGSDSRNPPIPKPLDIMKSGMGLDIKNQVGNLDATNVAAVTAATKALAQSDVTGTTPFSAFLSTGIGKTEPRVSILGGDDNRVSYGIHANRNAAVDSTGETTGSWARDLLRGLASIAGLTPEKSQLGDSYVNFVTTVRNGLESSVDALALERGSLGVTEDRLQKIVDHHESVSTTLKLQLSDLEEVDMPETITAFQTTQTQLEASYRAIGIAQQLSLTRFL
ncbi:MAG: flagellin [Alphaproteobacteria bacterium]|jgi:flagellar hook-associated protein 3 FlgL